MKREEKDKKFQWVLFSDLFLAKLKPILIFQGTKQKIKIKKGFTTTKGFFKNCSKIDLKNLSILYVFFFKLL